MYIYKEESVLKSKCKADPEIRLLGLNKKTRLFSNGEKRKFEHPLKLFSFGTNRSDFFWKGWMKVQKVSKKCSIMVLKGYIAF